MDTISKAVIDNAIKCSQANGLVMLAEWTLDREGYLRTIAAGSEGDAYRGNRDGRPWTVQLIRR